MMLQVLKGPISLLRILIGTRNNFSDHYRQFGYALSKRFASSVFLVLYGSDGACDEVQLF
jgi:hypothetical protein